MNFTEFQLKMLEAAATVNNASTAKKIMRILENVTLVERLTPLGNDNEIKECLSYLKNAYKYLSIIEEDFSSKKEIALFILKEIQDILFP